MATDMQEDTPGRVEASATSGAIPAAIEEHLQILRQLSRQAREDARATREEFRAMNARMDRLDAGIDRLFYAIIGFGSALMVGLVAILIKLFLDG